jgi:hypothetical protein
MRRLAGNLVLAALAIFALSACSPSDDEETVSETQKYYFLESLQLVEQAGRSLQGESRTQQDIRQALAIMDQGLKLAFQVENKFLKQLDVRLGKNYQRYFVKGVEDYRLGIEAGDREQQQNGLRLLARWAKFWASVKPAVDLKLHPQ